MQGHSHDTARAMDNCDGSAIVAGDWDITVGPSWGTTATKTVVAGSTDTRGGIDIGSAGTGQTANPQAKLTFKDGAFKDKNGANTVPFVVVSRGDVSAAAGDFRVTARLATSFTVTFIGTPVAAQTYTLHYRVVP
jgi:hypothetical protein